MARSLFQRLDQLFESRASEARSSKGMTKLQFIELVGGNRLRRLAGTRGTAWLEVVFPEPDSKPIRVVPDSPILKGDAQILEDVLTENLRPPRRPRER